MRVQIPWGPLDEKNLDKIVQEENYSNSQFKIWLVDTSLAHLIFTPICAANEYFIAGMDSEKVIKARIVGLLIGSLTTRPYTIFADWFLKKCGVSENSSSTKKYLVETGGGLMLNTSTYCLLLYASGASEEEIKAALPVAITMSLTTTRPFRYALNKWRKYWNVKPALDE